ncbi:MAG TPA: MFS transporter [Candidatus Polarisedimenticolia bacterium]|nr:MFS transporter [Candidatus Polarisedimenticolia bacterium]
MLDRNALAILFLTLFLVMLGVGIIIPNIAYRASELEASPIEISLLFTLYSLMQFLFAPFWGHLSDRIGRKPVLLVGLFGGGAGLLLFGMASHLPLLYAARAISGLMSSAALPTAMAYVADVTDERGRGRGMGSMGAAIGLGFIFGPGIGGFLSHFGHDTPFLVAGILSLVTGIGAAVLLRESLPPEKRRHAGGSWFRLPTPWRAIGSPLAPFYGIVFAVPFAMAALETTFPLLLRDRLGLGAREMGTMFLFMGTAVFLVQGFLLGRLINALGEERVLRAGLLLNALGFLLVPAANGPATMTAALVLSGVGNQVMRPTSASLITKRTEGGQGAAIGVMDSFDSLGRILGPLLAGPAYATQARLPYFLSAGILIAAMGLLVLRGGSRGGASTAAASPAGSPVPPAPRQASDRR